MGKFKDLSGMIFSRLKVISFAGMGARGRASWKCECICGKSIITRSSDLLQGKSKSCGCLNIDRIKERSTTHGEANNRSREYTAWANMMSRCYCKTNPRYNDWGGRGVSVCDRWRNSFKNFLEDMMRSPGKGYSLDRIENDKGYSKDNCRWATLIIQVNNTRRSKKIEYNGKMQTLSEWSNEVGINYSIIKGRIWSGWTVEKALNTKPKCRMQ